MHIGLYNPKNSGKPNKNKPKTRHAAVVKERLTFWSNSWTDWKGKEKSNISLNYHRQKSKGLTSVQTGEICEISWYKQIKLEAKTFQWNLEMKILMSTFW